MTAETISVGTEILLGNIVNTNAAYLAQQYAKLGIESYYQTAVGDNPERLTEALRLASSRSDLIVLTGGLGPTQDDITKETVAEYFGKKLYPDEVTAKRIKAFFESRGTIMADNNIRQAMIPEDAVILDNSNGLAPGILMETEEGKAYILLPGPPEEMRAVWEAHVEPYLRKKTGDVIYSSMVKVCGLAESEIAEQLDDLIRSNGSVTVAPYAKTAEVHLRVTAHGQSEKEARKLVKPVVKEIKGRLGNSVYTTHEERTLEEEVVGLLQANQLTVTTVESCTGGLIAGRIINVPGVSEVYKSGFITYSNKAKRKLVGVKKKTLDKYGAVSAQTVTEMVKGAAAFTRADAAIAVSGIAGPDGGTEEKPVGLVYIGVSVCGEVTVQEYHFNGDRAKIRESAVANALILLRRCVLEHYSRDLYAEEDG